MIDINEYLERLDEEEGREEQEREAYQRELFEAYVLRRTDHEPERRELMRLYPDGHPESAWRPSTWDILGGPI